ncbi:hypothetical protein BD770DRAFT_406151 [Pilaira anomala]|nr:hypothetical protein BD770DRAFT_406151 [Pilaira anomala]
MVKYQPIFLLCLAHLSHIAFGAAVANTENNVRAYRYKSDGSKIDIPRNFLKRGGGDDDDYSDGNKEYGNWEVANKGYKKSQDGGHNYYDDYDDSDNEWDHEWYNKFGFKSYYDDESSDEQGWTKNKDWESEIFNDADTASCPTLDTTTITTIVTVPGGAVTSTVTAPGGTATSTITAPGETVTSTVTASGETVTASGEAVTSTVTETGDYITVFRETNTLFGETLTLTSTEWNTYIGFTSTILTTTTTTSILNPVVTIFSYVTLPCTSVATVTVTA